MCTQRSEEHTSELQSHVNLVCRLLLEKKNEKKKVSQYLAARIGHTQATFDAKKESLDSQSDQKKKPLLKLQAYWKSLLFFFKVAATTEIYTLSLHDALPI